MMPSFPFSSNSKPALRRQALDYRRTLPMAQLSARICQQLAQWPVFLQATQVLTYHPFRHEVDLCPLLDAFPEKQWYLPVILSAAQPMRFYPYHPNQPLQAGLFGILEPPTTAPPLEIVSSDALLLLPGLLFDEAGYRLGYGKGYYDRFLEQQPSARLAGKRIGIAPSGLLCKKLPVEDWDIPLDGVMTEAGLVHPRLERRFNRPD